MINCSYPICMKSSNSRNKQFMVDWKSLLQTPWSHFCYWFSSSRAVALKCERAGIRIPWRPSKTQVAGSHSFPIPTPSPRRFWFNSSGLGPWNFHFQQVPRWGWRCQLEAYNLFPLSLIPVTKSILKADTQMITQGSHMKTIEFNM